MKKIYIYCWYLTFAVILCGCGHISYLDEKPDQSLVVPTTLSDLQGILDNDRFMNGTYLNEGLIPSLGEIGADDYFHNNPALFKSRLSVLNQHAYEWIADVFVGQEIIRDWNDPYYSIFYANVVLDQLKSLPSEPDNAVWRNLKGSALFYRAHLFYQLAQVFAVPYQPGNTSSQWGIPLRLSADVNEKIERASLEKTYDQILNDLTNALPFLPTMPAFKTRPSQAACYALLARIYQTMQRYDKALAYADSSLAIHPDLMDYQHIAAGTPYPFSRFNEEVLFHTTLLASGGPLPLARVTASVDSDLYATFDTDDQRKTLYFQKASGTSPGMIFNGSYDGTGNTFAGLATDEVYLIRAECLARLAQTEAAMACLHQLLEKRWKENSYIPYQASTPDQALTIVLSERRKELLFRGLRWADLRRLNQDPGFAKTLTRVQDGVTYTLPPNDLRYTYPIPNSVLSFHPDMAQNSRE